MNEPAPLAEVLSRLSAQQRTVLREGDCNAGSFLCICRSPERFRLHTYGLAELNGELTPLGLELQAFLLEEDKP